MKINWKVRAKNPVWWVQIGMSILTPILAYAGLTASDMTSWEALFDMVLNAVKNPYVLGLVFVSVWNTVNDPTTAGVNDSKQALAYNTPKKGE